MTMDSYPPVSDEPLPPLERAPTQEAWDAMNPEQREAAIEALPLMLPISHIVQRGMAEGDEHAEARGEVRDTLRRWYRSRERQVYVGSEMTVYYPGDEPVVPDVFVVHDVSPHKRKTWVVSKEGRGVEWALEVLGSGRRAKDLRRNVTRYAALGIIEYFVFDLRTRRLHGWRQASRGVRRYEPIVRAGESFYSEVLKLDMLVVGRRLRFREGTSELLATEDLIERLEETVAELAVRVEEQAAFTEHETARAEREAARAEQEAARAEQEAVRAEQEAARAERERIARLAAESDVAALRAELERLRGAASR